MNPNNDLPDYMMFGHRSPNIDFDKFKKLIDSNIYSTTDFEPSFLPPKRMSYRVAIALLPKNGE